MHGNDLKFLKQRGYADWPTIRIFRFSFPDLLQQNRAVMRCLEVLPPTHLSSFWANVLFDSSKKNTHD